MRSFGSQFGNALYDKTQKNVDYKTPSSPQSQQSQNVQPQTHSSSYGEFQSLGLGIAEQNGEIVVTGQTYGKQQTIKKYGFRWDANRKIWYKSQKQVA